MTPEGHDILRRAWMDSGQVVVEFGEDSGCKGKLVAQLVAGGYLVPDADQGGDPERLVYCLTEKGLVAAKQ